MIYTATITTASLRVRASRIIAGLLLQGISDTSWKEAIITDNVLQMDSPESIRCIAGLLRVRMEPLGKGIWQMIRDGDREQAAQATFAGAVKNSRFLGDFMNLALREQRVLFAKKLEYGMWNDYIAGCRGCDPDMPHWSHAIGTRLRSAVFSMLAEVGYIRDTRSLLLQNVFVDTQLATVLRDRGETYVLRCMEVTE